MRFPVGTAADPLDEHKLAAVATGVSTRRQASTLDPGAGRRDRTGDVEQFRVAAVRGAVEKRREAFLDRPLGELDPRVVCIDGKVFRDHCMVLALGIDAQGEKHAPGPARRRHRDRCRHHWPVIDRASGLRRAITDLFGPRRVVQCCQVHRCRNVRGHFPERLHASVAKALRDAWDLDSAERAGRC